MHLQLKSMQPAMPFFWLNYLEDNYQIISFCIKMHCLITVVCPSSEWRASLCTCPDLWPLFLKDSLQKLVEIWQKINVKMRLVCLFLLVSGSVFAEEDDKRDSVGTVIGIDLGTTYSWWEWVWIHIQGSQGH